MSAATTQSPANATKLLTRVADYYAKALYQKRSALDYLSSLKLNDPVMLETFAVGYSNGELRKVLPKSGQVIDGLTALGVLLPDGSEALAGKIIIPLRSASGAIVSLHGIDIQTGNPITVGQAGMLNPSAVRQYQSLMAVRSVLEVMALWQAGFKEALFLGSLTSEELQSMLSDSKADTFKLCIPATQAEGWGELEDMLKAAHIRLQRIQWPEGINNALEFLAAKGGAQAMTTLLEESSTSYTAAPVAGEVQQLEGGFAVCYGVRRYELRAVRKPSASQLKATIKASYASKPGRFYIDTLNLYVGRARNAFIGEVARLFDASTDLIERDLSDLTERLEQWERGNDADAQGADGRPAISAEGKQLAEQMGRDRELIALIAEDLETLGLVGETANKLTAYLAMCSRKTDDPLSVLCLSGSGVGKSHLQDAVLRLCPEEDLLKLTALSDRALFYKGEDALRHKVLALEEDIGGNGAAYAIRNLISAQKLTFELTGRHASSGELETQSHTVYGPTAVFQTTTDPEGDPETRSRFLLISIDESADQTQRILQAQRERHTLAGRRRLKQAEDITRRHHAFQRLLQPVTVINPFEPLLDFQMGSLSARRDQPKYLNLILTITFLHQMQRLWKHDPEIGDYIESSLEDIAIANELAAVLFRSNECELNGPVRELLRLMQRYVSERAASEQQPQNEIEFTRRELREAIGWSEYQMRAHLKHLQKLEYVHVSGSRQGQVHRYRMVRPVGTDTTTAKPAIKSVQVIYAEAVSRGLLDSEQFTALELEQLQLRATSWKPVHEVNVASSSVLEPNPVAVQRTSCTSSELPSPIKCA